MEKELKTVVDNCGLGILQDPDRLMGVLRQNNCQEKEILTLCLILRACPAVSNMVMQGNINMAEGNALLCAVVSATGLSISLTRKMLKEIIAACGLENRFAPSLIMHEPKPDGTLQPMSVEEAQSVDALLAQLNQDEQSSKTLYDLDQMSAKGSITASYALGMYYHPMDKKHGTAYGKRYFLRAASQGYGPANGALAFYELQNKRPDLQRASTYFESPNAISGDDGHCWADVSSSLLVYREQNAKRQKMVLGLSICMLCISILLLLLGNVALNVFSIVGIVVQTACLAWCLFSKMVTPYMTTTIAGYASMAGWLLVVLGIL